MPTSKHAKAQRRLRGTTYKLVRRGYEERQQLTSAEHGTATDGAGNVWESDAGPQWVDAKEMDRAQRAARSSAQARAAGGGGEDADGWYDDELYDGEDGGYWEEQGGDGDEEEEGEWIEDGDGADDEWMDEDDFDAEFGDGAEERVGAEVDLLVRQPQPRTDGKPSKTVKFATAADVAESDGDERRGLRRARHEADDGRVAAEHAEEDLDAIRPRTDPDDDKLFEDEVEGELTEEFLRQLVFGTAPVARPPGPTARAQQQQQQGEDELDENFDVAAASPPPGMDAELWNLLSAEEREGVLRARLRGTRRRQRPASHRAADRHAGEPDEDGGEYDDDGAFLRDADEGMEYPQHAAEEGRALERQFDAMMAEFEADMPINDFFEQNEDGESTSVAYTDPRTQGPLSINKYLSTLEEFVERKAGVDLESSEPRKNKGLLTQLKFLAHNAGAFDYDERHNGVYLTSVPGEKAKRFAQEYREETESIRKAAKMRVLRQMLEERRASEHAEAAARGTDDRCAPSSGSGDDVGEKIVAVAEAALAAGEGQEEAYDVLEIKNTRKAERVDCETAASAYSSYYNQPNVIRATSSAAGAAKRRSRRAAGRAKEDAADTLTASVVASNLSRQDAEGERDARAAVSFVRERGETKEEKKMRRQKVKEMQRDRRQQKSELKKTYVEMEKEEASRAALAHSAKRTTSFL